MNAEQLEALQCIHAEKSEALTHLGVECTLQRRVSGLVDDAAACSVLQQDLDDSLIAPTRCHVHRRVAFIVLQVQAARLRVVVDQSLHTLTHNTGSISATRTHLP